MGIIKGLLFPCVKRIMQGLKNNFRSKRPLDRECILFLVFWMANYKGRTVTLNKPFKTPNGPKKSAVYVKSGTKTKIVRFGDPNMSIKKNIPARRKSFRARHKCATAKDKTTPRYWSCKAW